MCRSWEANENLPYHRCNTQFINGGWPEVRNLTFSLPGVRILCCPGVQTFFQEFGLIWGILQNFVGYGFHDCCLGQVVDQSSGGEKNCSVYSLFCIFIIIFIIIITSINSSITISFVALLNCL